MAINVLCEFSRIRLCKDDLDLLSSRYFDLVQNKHFSLTERTYPVAKLFSLCLSLKIFALSRDRHDSRHVY